MTLILISDTVVSSVAYTDRVMVSYYVEQNSECMMNAGQTQIIIPGIVDSSYHCRSIGLIG